MKKITCTGARETIDLGHRLGQAICRGVAIALTGDLGTGKTTLIQGLARGLGVDEAYYITSPTFTIINEYPAGDFRLCHLDLYRLADPEELDYIGFSDLLTPATILAVEWPDMLRASGFDFDLDICLEYDADFNRIISVFPTGQRGAKVLSRLFS
jgi:tRNA threonylcarbamoyladenosine biosynthesis protein TsaE